MVESHDLITRITRAATRIDPGLTEKDIGRIVEGSHRRRRHRLVKRAALTTAILGVATVLLVRWESGTVPPTGVRAVDQGGPTTTPAAPPAPAPLPAPARALVPGTIRLADGSTAEPLDVETRLRTVEDTPRRASVQLDRGRGRFDVKPAEGRAFEVRVGDVVVVVVGTVFTVERVADRVGVTVERGIVRVNWAIGEQQLHAGESGWFPPLQIRVPSDRRSAEALLKAADAERLAGRPEEGARLLRQILLHHRADPRAPLAAFTLGRVLLMELRQPAQAALAFSHARALAPRGPFAEDALAREVEALSLAGDTGAAHRRARAYLRQYPNGRRADTVKGFGGID